MPEPMLTPTGPHLQQWRSSGTLLVRQEQVAIGSVEEVTGHKHSSAVVLTNSGLGALLTVRQRARTSTGDWFQYSCDLPAEGRWSSLQPFQASG